MNDDVHLGGADGSRSFFGRDWLGRAGDGHLRWKNDKISGGRSPPDLASVETRFENYGRSCVRDTGNKSTKFSNLASTGMKPVGGRKNSWVVRLVVGKPSFHRHEAGWGTLDSMEPSTKKPSCLVTALSSRRRHSSDFAKTPLTSSEPCVLCVIVHIRPAG